MKSSVAEATIETTSFTKTRSRISDYVQLTKPRIVLLFALTGMAAMGIERSLFQDAFRFWMIVLGIVLTAGSANALNQYIDRDIDAVMERTKKKRPLPNGRLAPQNALWFALIIGTLATWLLYEFGSFTAAFWGVFTIGFYVGIYTLWLKRRTPYNIVIGGAAGATAPLIGWAAATGHTSLCAWTLFLIVFMWTPAHFWALALHVKDEYAKAEVPMLPVVAGERVTRNQIFLYTVITVLISFLPYLSLHTGLFYLVSAALLGYGFIKKAYKVLKAEKVDPEKRLEWKLFGYSIVYLLALFVVLLVDSLISA